MWQVTYNLIHTVSLTMLQRAILIDIAQHKSSGFNGLGLAPQMFYEDKYLNCIIAFQDFWR